MRETNLNKFLVEIYLCKLINSNNRFVFKKYELEAKNNVIVNQSDCEMVEGQFHNQFQLFGGYKDE